MFFCESFEIFKHTVFHRTHSVVASGNISWTLSLLYIRTMNGVISWNVLALQRIFHFIACASILSISSFFSCFFCGFYYLLRYWGKFVHLKQSSGIAPMFISRVTRGELRQPYLVINANGLVQLRKNLIYILHPLVS